MNPVKKVLKNSFYQYLSKVVMLIFSLVLSILLTRYLGTTDYGIFIIASSISMALIIFANLGFDESLIYFVSKYINKDKKIKVLISFSLKLRFILSLMIGIIIFLVSDYVAVIYSIPLLSVLLKIFSINAFLTSIMTYFGIVFESFQNFKYKMFQELVFSIAKVIPIIFILFNLGIIMIAWSYNINYLIGVIFSIPLFYFIMSNKKISKSSSKVDYKEFFSYSFFIFSGTIVERISNYIINPFLGYVRTPEEVSFFAVSMFLIGAVMLLPSSINSALFPSLSESFANKIRDFKKIFKDVIKYNYLFIIPSSALLFIFGQQIVSIVYGYEFSVGATPIIQVLSLYMISEALTQFFISLYNSTGKPLDIVKIKTAKSIVLITLIIFLGIFYGGVGAAIAMLLSSTVPLVYLNIKSAKDFKISFETNKLIKIVFATIIAGTIAYFGVAFNDFIISVLSVIFGGIIYLGLTYILNCWNKNDWILFIQFIKFIRRGADLR